MKKFFLPALCAVAALSLYSCSENIVDSDVEQYERSINMVELSLTGSLEPETKTVYNRVTTKTQWVKNDAINILGAHTNTSAAASNI